MKKIIDEDAVLSIKKEVLSSRIGEEIVLLNMDTGSYYKMDPIASVIWDMLKSPVSIEKVCANLLEEFDVDIHECTKDVLDFVNLLNHNKMLVIHPK